MPLDKQVFPLPSTPMVYSLPDISQLFKLNDDIVYIRCLLSGDHLTFFISFETFLPLLYEINMVSSEVSKSTT